MMHMPKGCSRVFQGTRSQDGICHASPSVRMPPFVLSALTSLSFSCTDDLFSGLNSQVSWQVVDVSRGVPANTQLQALAKANSAMSFSAKTMAKFVYCYATYLLYCALCYICKPASAKKSPSYVLEGAGLRDIGLSSD